MGTSWPHKVYDCSSVMKVLPTKKTYENRKMYNFQMPGWSELNRQQLSMYEDLVQFETETYDQVKQWK